MLFTVKKNKVKKENAMEVDEWSIVYVPTVNSGDIHAAWGGCLFDIYGEDWIHVRSSEPNKVWTWVEHDGGTAIIPGIHFVNRLGYFVTEFPWSDWTIEVDVEEF